MKKNVFKRVKPWCVPVGLTLFFYVMLKFVIFVGYVPTESMEPTLPKGSIIIGTRIFRVPQVGDVIVFEKDGLLMVKRVAAVSGEVIDLTKLTYMKETSLPDNADTVVAVPPNSFFVLGDNTRNSWDSRYWEEPFVTLNQIKAVIVCPDLSTGMGSIGLKTILLRYIDIYYIPYL